MVGGGDIKPIIIIVNIIISYDCSVKNTIKNTQILFLSCLIVKLLSPIHRDIVMLLVSPDAV